MNPNPDMFAMAGEAALALLDNAPDVISRFDRSFRYLFINKTAERSTGIPREAFIGKTFRELGFPEENCLLWEQSLRRTFETGELTLIEFSVLLPIGLRHYEGRSVPERGPDGEVQTVLTTTRDVTERKEAELAVRESEQRFRTAARLATDNIYEWDVTTGEVRWFTDLAGRLGYTQEELPASFASYQRILHPDDRERLQSVLERTLAEGETYREEVRFIAKDGSLRHFVDHAMVLRDAQGRPVKLVGVNADITEQKKAEQVIRDAAQTQRQFLREMLFAMSEGRLRLCESEDELPAPLLPPASEQMDLSRPSLRLFRRQVAATAETLGMLEQRLNDLISAVGEAAMNAVVHAGGGTGQVYADSERGVVQVWVRDMGPGMAEDMIHRATLERGWTTKGTLGHGFWMMLRTCDRIYLLTGQGGTTVVLEQEKQEPLPLYLQRM